MSKGRTKLKITIEVDETFEETYALIQKLNSKGFISINDLLSQNARLIATKWSNGIHAVNPQEIIVGGFLKQPPDPTVTEVNFVLDAGRFDTELNISEEK